MASWGNEWSASYKGPGVLTNIFVRQSLEKQ